MTSQPQIDFPANNRVGILAGWGRFPIEVAEKLNQQGTEVYCLGIKQHADPVLQELATEFQWVGALRLGKAIRTFQKWGITHATMAGKYHKTLLFQPRLFLQHCPDWKYIKTFYPQLMKRKDHKDDTLLGTVVNAFAKEGITFAPATDYASELLVKTGHIAGQPLTENQQLDIAFGWDIAKQMGGLDIGQSVCVKKQAVLAVEAIEGTDACIARAGQLCSQGGFTVVKVAKPDQDMRFDVPTIGIQTLEQMVEVGAQVLAIEGEQTILLDQDKFCQFANQHKITVVALTSPAEQAFAA